MFNTEIQDGHQKWRVNDFCKKVASTLYRYPAGQKLLLSGSVSEINTFLRFTQKFKMATKSGWEKVFCVKVASRLATYPVGQKFRRNRSIFVSEINSFLRLTQKFKMATKSGEKTIFVKICQ